MSQEQNTENYKGTSPFVGALDGAANGGVLGYLVSLYKDKNLTKQKSILDANKVLLTELKDKLGGDGAAAVTVKLAEVEKAVADVAPKIEKSNRFAYGLTAAGAAVFGVLGYLSARRGKKQFEEMQARGSALNGTLNQVTQERDALAAQMAEVSQVIASSPHHPEKVAYVPASGAVETSPMSHIQASSVEHHHGIAGHEKPKQPHESHDSAHHSDVHHAETPHAQGNVHGHHVAAQAAREHSAGHGAEIG